MDALPERDLEVKEIHSVPSTSQTDIGQAIRLALAAFPSGVSRRIVLFSDGNETLGNALDEAAIAKSNNVAVDVVPLGQELVGRLRRRIRGRPLADGVFLAVDQHLPFSGEDVVVLLCVFVLVVIGVLAPLQGMPGEGPEVLQTGG